MAPSARGLIDRQVANRREIALGQGLLDVVFTDRHHPMQAQVHEPRHGAEGHLARKRKRQRLEEQREALEPPGPLGLHLADRPVRELHPRGAHLEVALVLEEVQVLEPLGHGVVHRVPAGCPRHGKATSRREVDANGERACRGIEINAGHEPRCGNPQGSLEQFLGHRYQVEIG